MCNLYCLSQYSFNIVQVFQPANILFVLNLIVSRKTFHIYILRLLAGKSGTICTEFPLATLLAEILIRFAN